MRLARDKSRKGRSALVVALNDLYSGDGQILSDQDRAMMAGIMRQLINDVELSVRRSLADHLAGDPNTPRDLVLALANDEIEVAHPILANSEVLRDEELIEIIQYRAMEHQVAIAARPTVSEPVSDALVETRNENVIETLLDNRGAAISSDTMDRLVDQSRTVTRFQKPLVLRHDLSPQLAKKLYWGVSAALRKHIVENFDIDANDLDEAFEISVKGMMGEKTDPVTRGRGMAESADDGHGFVSLLRKGGVLRFVDKLAEATGLRVGLVRRLLFEEGGEGLAIACKAIGIGKDSFLNIFLQFRSGRIGDKRVAPDEVSKAASFYHHLDLKSAQAMLRRWQRDPDYLNALRLIEQN